MFFGIDLHDHETQVVVVDDDGNLQNEFRLPTDRLDDLAEEYAGSEAAIEASGIYRHAYEMLDEHLDVTVANPSQNRLIADATVKTDRLDAKRLAHLLHNGWVAESYVPEDEIRELRDLVRARKSLVEERTAEKNRIRAVLKRTNNTYDSELFGPRGREFLAELSLSDPDRTIVEAHLAVIDELDEQIGMLEEKIEQRVLESPAAQLLLTIPGVGQTTAAVIVAELGEIERFDTHKEPCFARASASPSRDWPPALVPISAPGRLAPGSISQKVEWRRRNRLRQPTATRTVRPATSRCCHSRRHRPPAQV